MKQVKYILSKFSNNFSKFSNTIFKKYTVNRIEHKLKKYSKEKEDLYNKIGTLIYLNHLKNNDSQVPAYVINICEDITDITQKQIFLNTKLSKSTPSYSSKASNNLEGVYTSTEFDKLSKKDNDLKFTRTKDGIKIVKLNEND